MIRIPGYSRLYKIHEGSDSVIYRAIDIQRGEPVIVKAAREEQPSVALIKRYRQEYEIAKSIESEGALKVYDLENISNSLFLIFENFDGESLKSILERRIFQTEEFLLVGIKLSQTLYEIHHAGIIHRDINPSNVVYNPQTGQIKLIDFGIAIKADSFNIPNVLEGTITP